MSLFIKAALTSSTRNPGDTSNAQIVYKIVSSTTLANEDELKHLCEAFLGDQGIAYKSNQETFSQDGVVDIDLLYCEFGYQVGVDAVPENQSLLVPDENGYNSYVDSAELVGKDFLSGSELPPDSEYTTSYSFSSRIYKSIYINRYYYNLANKKCFNQRNTGSPLPNDDTVYVNYSDAKFVSFLVTPNDGNPSYLLNLVFISSDQLEYQEDFSSRFYTSAGQYYASSALDTLYLRVMEHFFPFLVLKRSDVVHGSVFDSLNATLNPIDWNSENYVSIEPFDFTEPVLPIMSCVLDDSGARNGYVSIVYGDEVISESATQLCGETAATRFLFVKPTSDQPLTLYKDFSSIIDYYADLYLYNARYVKYRKTVSNADTYYAFLDNSSLATSTVKFASQALDITKYSSIKEDPDGGGISSICLTFIAYYASQTEATALRNELIIPVWAQSPTIESLGQLGDQIVVTTNYATHLVYYFGDDPNTATTVAITDSADGLTQVTNVSAVGQVGTFTAKAYNYLYTLPEIAEDETKNLYITSDHVLNLAGTISVASFSFNVKVSGVNQTIYSTTDPSSTSLSFNPLLQNSFGSYWILAPYTTTTDYVFTYSFTLSTGETLAFVVGGFSYDLTSGTGVPISRNDLFVALSSDKYWTPDLKLVLDEAIEFKVPVRFLSTSANAPTVTSITTPVVNLTENSATATFSISHQYSSRIRYTIKNEKGSVLYSAETESRDYPTLQPYFSAGSTETVDVVTGEFSVGASESIFVIVEVFNFNASGVEVSASSTSSSVALIKKLREVDPARFIFYSDQAKTTQVTKMSKGVTYYAFLQLVASDGTDLATASYGDYIDTDSLSISAVESADDNIDIDAGVSVIDLGNYLYSIKVNADSEFNDTNFSMSATFDTIAP